MVISLCIIKWNLYYLGQNADWVQDCSWQANHVQTRQDRVIKLNSEIITQLPWHKSTDPTSINKSWREKKKNYTRREFGFLECRVLSGWYTEVYEEVCGGRNRVPDTGDACWNESRLVSLNEWGCTLRGVTLLFIFVPPVPGASVFTEGRTK